MIPARTVFFRATLRIRSGILMSQRTRPLNMHLMFRNMGGRFDNVTRFAGCGDIGFGQGVAVGDYNDDGFPDLFVLNVGENRLLRNNGERHPNPVVAWGCWWADLTARKCRCTSRMMHPPIIFSMGHIAAIHSSCKTPRPLCGPSRRRTGAESGFDGDGRR